MGSSGAHTLQTTALVNEAYLRLAGQDAPRLRRTARISWRSRQTAMRQILVDHARTSAAPETGRPVRQHGRTGRGSLGIGRARRASSSNSTRHWKSCRRSMRARPRVVEPQILRRTEARRDRRGDEGLGGDGPAGLDLLPGVAVRGTAARGGLSREYGGCRRSRRSFMPRSMSGLRRAGEFLGRALRGRCLAAP